MNSQREDNITGKKIIVMGDTWKRLFIVPEGASKNKETYKSLLLDGGAARLSSMIKAATGCTTMEHYYIPQKETQIVTSGLLRQYIIEDRDKETVESIFEKAEEPTSVEIGRPYRVERELGIGQLEGISIKGVTKNFNGKSDNEDYWVIFEDHMEDRTTGQRNIKSAYEGERQAWIKIIGNEVEKDRLPSWILWSPRDFGKEEKEQGKKKDEPTRFQSILFEGNGNGYTEKAKKLQRHTIVFLQMDLLTEAGIGSRDDLSLEECIDGVTEAFNCDKQMKRLLECKAVVINCGIDFAFFVYRDEGELKFEVFFRTVRTCQFYRNDIGFIQRYGLFMVASCLKGLINSEGDFHEKIVAGIRDGLWRTLMSFLAGYSIKGDFIEGFHLEHDKYIFSIPGPHQNTMTEELEKDEKWQKTIEPFTVRNVPLRNIRNNITHPSVIYRLLYKHTNRHEREFVAPWLMEQQWDDKIREGNGKDKEFLESIVKEGLKVMSSKGDIKFPIAILRKKVVVDVEEVGMYRNLLALMRKYAIDEKDKRPLGLAVFGAPGSGKSFGVKEVAMNVWWITKPEHLKIVECNLAQFSSPDDLFKKLLDAQDMCNDGHTIPTIFLDEFDSQLNGEIYGWFKYLLALLQDGTFRYEGVLHQLGKCFVVCAGGINKSFLEFKLQSDDPEFIAAKGPDLISRLRGYVNVKGPNPYSPFSFESPKLGKMCPDYADEVFDKYRNDLEEFGKEALKNDDLYKIRRAVEIRTHLKDVMPSIFSEKMAADIDDKVLHALLNISEYKYGTRSIRAILEMSVSSYRHSRKFVRAMIPSPDQLEIHVDAVEFYRLLEEKLE